MIDLKKYSAYFEDRPDDTEYEVVLSATLVEGNLSPSELELFKVWAPEADGDYTVQVYHQGKDGFLRQRVNPAWHSTMKDVFGLLEMVPEKGREHWLINDNVDKVKSIAFDSEEGEWRIIEWRTQVTESAQAPFVLTYKFPVEGNLLCDEIVFEHPSTGRKAAIRYGWNAYID